MREAPYHVSKNQLSKFTQHHLKIIHSLIPFLIILALNKSLFEYKYAIGRGGFGKVWRVSSSRLKNEKITQFAMKEMLKARVMHKKSIQSVMNELKLLSMINSKFIVNAHYAF
jgi:serine/threonine protein kinase